MKIKYVSVILLVIYCFICKSQGQFGQQTDCGVVECKDLKEASGIASSKKNPGVLWSHNDSGDKNRIFAMSNKGKNLGIYYLDNCPARDWEDIATGPGPEDGKSYIYVGNIGDNDAQYDVKYIYRFEEPVVAIDQKTKTDTIKNIDILQFVYPDGKRDAETVMVDPLTKDCYIVSKREPMVRVYKAAYPQPISSVDTLKCVDTLNLTYVVAGDISPSGTEIILKDYDKIYYWKRLPNESIQSVLLRTPETLPYTKEPQGEGLAWDYNGSGYYTISEEDGDDCHLYYYPRIEACIHFGNNKKKFSVLRSEKILSNYLLSGRSILDNSVLKLSAQSKSRIVIQK